MNKWPMKNTLGLMGLPTMKVTTQQHNLQTASGCDSTYQLDLSLIKDTCNGWSFNTRTVFQTTSGGSVRDILVIDLDSDGDQDIIYTEKSNPTTFIGSCIWLINDGHGNFNNSDTILTGSKIEYLTGGDVDNDGDNDLVLYKEYKRPITMVEI